MAGAVMVAETAAETAADVAEDVEATASKAFGLHPHPGLTLWATNGHAQGPGGVPS
jgi:hypothetical protein